MSTGSGFGFGFLAQDNINNKYLLRTYFLPKMTEIHRNKQDKAPALLELGLVGEAGKKKTRIYTVMSISE